VKRTERMVCADFATAKRREPKEEREKLVNSGGEGGKELAELIKLMKNNLKLKGKRKCYTK
jgi:hypothetical protein